MLTDWRATIRSVLKVVYFLRMKKRARFGVYLSIPKHSLIQSKVSKIPETFSYYMYSLTIYWPYKYLTSSRAALKVPHLNFSLIIWHIRDLDVWSRGKEVKLCKVSDGTRVVGKYLGKFLIPCFGSRCVWEWRNIPQTVRKKFTTFSTERILALRSVNKIFPESYDFAAYDF
jgi:hypothetical protein